MNDLNDLFDEVEDIELKEFFVRYMKDGFGCLSKHDIDLLVWYLAAKKIKGLKNKSTYELANLMKIPESKIKTLQMESWLKYRNSPDDLKYYLDEVIQKIKNGFIRPELEGGKIRFLVDDPVLKREVENAIKSTGYVIDYSFNKDVVSIKLAVFVEAFSGDEQLKNSIVEILKKQCEANEKLCKKIENDSNLELILKVIGHRLGGEAGKQIGEKIFGTLKDYLFHCEEFRLKGLGMHKTLLMCFELY